MVATRSQRRAAQTPPASASDSGAKKKEQQDKKRTLWARYQTLLVERPLVTNLIQGAVIAGAGAVTAQLIESGNVTSWAPVLEQVALTILLITPMIQVWLGLLGSLRLHWIAATCVDQFVFSPVFNIAIFLFIAAVFKGGIAVSGGSVSLKPEIFPSITAYEPVWSTQITAYRLWLPATLVREAAVPPHLKGLFSTSVAFVWNIIFAFILTAAA